MLQRGGRKQQLGRQEGDEAARSTRGGMASSESTARESVARELRTPPCSSEAQNVAKHELAGSASTSEPDEVRGAGESEAGRRSEGQGRWRCQVVVGARRGRAAGCL